MKWWPGASSSSPATRTPPMPRSTRPSSTRCAPAEAPLSATNKLTEAVARYLFKLMAYKDEYEVARLHTDTGVHGEDRSDVRRRLQAGAPPGAADVRQAQRQGRAASSGSSARGCATAFGVLARLKGLRGTALDVFGRTEERRTERALIQQYKRLHRRVAARPRRRAAGAGHRDRAHPRGHPRLRPREGAPSRCGAAEVGSVDGALARQGTDQRCGSSRPGAGLKGD